MSNLNKDIGADDQDWRPSVLAELGQTYGGLTGKSAADFGAGDGLYVTFLNVVNNTVVNPQLHESVVVGIRESQNRVQRGDLLLNGSSETPEEVGLCAQVDDDTGAYLNSFCFGFRPHTGAPIVPRFLAYHLRGPVGRRVMVSLAQGSTRYNLSKRALLAASIPLPSVKEQQAIAEALSDADALIESLERLIEKKRQLKQGVMQELLTGRRRLPGFAATWKKFSFHDVFRRINAKAFQIFASDYMLSGDFPVVDQGQRYVVGHTNRADKVFACPPTGVIVFGDHTCIVKYVDFDFAVGADGTQILTTFPSHDCRFHAFQLQARPITSTGYNRHFKHLLGREFRAPDSLEEQKAISKVLIDLESEIAAIECQLLKAGQVKQGMMQQLLTGRIRLT